MEVVPEDVADMLKLIEAYYFNGIIFNWKPAIQSV